MSNVKIVVWVGEITLVREGIQVCRILHSSWAFHPAPAETETWWPLSVFMAALPLAWLVFFVLMLGFSLWRQLQVHLWHLMFPWKSDCAIPVSCEREPGHILRKGWGAGCCWPWNPVGWSKSAIASQQQKNRCELWQKFTSTLGCGKTVEGKSSSRLALAPALENKGSPRGLWVCTAALRPEICLHSSYPVLQFFLSCVHSRGARYAQWRFSSSVSPSETCLYVMPLTYVVVLASIMWWISLG